MVIEVLGRIEISGREVRGVVARRLVTTLVVHVGESVSTDLLIDAAWGDDPPEHPPSALQNQISRLRARIGTERLVSTPSGYRLDPHGLDVAAFVREVELAREAGDSAERLGWLTDALGRWHGRPFAECGDLHVAIPERSRLERLADEARRRRVETLHELGRHDEVIAVASGALDPTRGTWADDGTVALVALSTGSVDGPRAGINLLRDYRDRLVDATGLEPGDVVRDAERSLIDGEVERTRRRPDEGDTPRRRDDGPAPTRQQLPWFGEIRHELPLVGRIRERRYLVRRLDEAAAGSGAVVSMVGESGVGKTRVVAAVVDEAKRRGFDVVDVNCVAGGLVRSPIETVIERLAGADTAARSSPGEASAEGARAALAIARAVERPTLVVVEDVHDADAVTASALDRLGEIVPPAGRPLLVVATSRIAGPQPPELLLAPHRLDEVAGLIRAVTGARPSQRLIHHAYERTEGNARALASGLGSLAMHDRLVTVDGELDLADDTAAAMLSVSADRVAEARVAALEPEQRELITSLANLAPSVAIDVAAMVMSTDVESLLRAISHPDLAGLVTVEQGAVTFAHGNARLAVGAMMSGADRHALHDRVVQCLGQPITDEETMTMAWHCARSTHPSRAHAVFEQAARLSMDRSDWSTAVTYFHLATDATAPPAALAVQAGEAAFRAFDPAEADRWYANGAARARDHRDIAGWASCVLGRERARLTASGVGSVDLGSLEDLVERTAELPAEHARLCALLSETSFAERRIDRARHWIERAIDAIDLVDDDSSAAAVAFSAGLTMLGALDLPAAVDHFGDADRLARSSGEPWISAWARTRSALASLMWGDLVGARAMAHRAREVAEMTHGSADLSLAMAVEANVCLIEGRIDEALLLSAEAESHWHRSRYPFSAPVLFPLLAECWRRSDDPDEAHAALERWRAAEVPGSSPWFLLHAAKTDDHAELRRRQQGRPLRLPPISELQLGNCAIAAILAAIATAEPSQEPVADAMAALIDLGVVHVPGFAETVEELLVSTGEIPPSSS